jgi:hypothetical protein
MAISGTAFQERGLLAQQAPAGNDRGVAAPEASDARARVQDQLELAKRAMSIIDKATQRGIPAIRQPQEVFIWSYRLLQAQIYLSLEPDEPKTLSPEVYLVLPKIKPKPERTTAFDDHWRRMKAWEDRLRGLIARGAMSPLDFTEIEAHRLEAEAWLAREKAKNEASR